MTMFDEKIQGLLQQSALQYIIYKKMKIQNELKNFIYLHASFYKRNLLSGLPVTFLQVNRV